MTLGRHCSFVPPYLLERIAASDSDAADHCHETLAVDEMFRAGRQGVSPLPTETATTAAWVVHTAANTSTLPGREVRTAGAPGPGDTSVDEAADNITAALAFHRDVLVRSSYDEKDADLVLPIAFAGKLEKA